MNAKRIVGKSESGSMPTHRVSEELQRIFQLAFQHHQAGRLTEAEPLYRQVLALNPNHADSHHLLGVLAHQAGASDAAIDLIEKAITLKRNVPAYHSNLGNALKDRGRLEDAAMQYRKALRLKPDYADACSNLGLVLTDQDKLDEAVAMFKRALIFKPNAAEILNNMGIALRARGKRHEALACYQKALAARPDYADAHNNMGNVSRDEGRLDNAVASYRNALAANPNFAKAHTNLGKALCDLGQLDEAIACHETALSISPQLTEAYVNLATIHVERGNLSLALNLLDIAEECCRTNPFPHGDYHLGDLFARCGDTARAAAHLGQYLAAVPAGAEHIASARFLLAGLGIGAIPEKVSEAHLEKLYIERARTWDRNASAGQRSYRGYKLVVGALETSAGHTAGLSVLDIGCGTGLVGELLVGHVKRLVGVDASSAMIEQAEGKRVYDEILKADIFSYLADTGERFDAATAAAVLIHFGDLRPLLTAVATVLRPSGVFVFTVFPNDDDDGIAAASPDGLAQGGCYAHGRGYISRVAEEAGFVVEGISSEVHEYIGDRPKTCFVVVLRKVGRL